MRGRERMNIDQMLQTELFACNKTLQPELLPATKRCNRKRWLLHESCSRKCWLLHETACCNSLSVEVTKKPLGAHEWPAIARWIAHSTKICTRDESVDCHFETEFELPRALSEPAWIKLLNNCRLLSTKNCA